MTGEALRALLRKHRVIAILRGVPEAHLLPTVEALAGGGVHLLEIALRGPGDTALVARVARAFPELVVGAGTVVSAELAERAAGDGAAFLLTPHVAEDAIVAAGRLGVPIIPGAYTPTEIQRCLALGCAAVKLFPAGLGGPEYLRALRGPYPELPLVAVGGVGPANLRDYLRAGALGVGIGSELTRTDGEKPDHAALRERVRACMQARPG